jgi:hypothetical protein
MQLRQRINNRTASYSNLYENFNSVLTTNIINYYNQTLEQQTENTFSETQLQPDPNNGDESIMNEVVMNHTDEQERECPLCSQFFSIRNYGYHILNEHPSLFTVLLSTYLQPLTEPQLQDANPTTNTPNAVNTFDELDGLDGVDEMEDTSFDFYSYYSNLCDMIGYELVGVDNLDKHAPILDTIEDELKCPVCLETFEENKRLFRRIERCKHEFCDDCASTWFSKHKKCPICMQEVQMADKSISESPSANSMASSALSASSAPST